MIHGDLKLSNALVDDAGVVKLTDFAFLKQTFILEKEGEPVDAFQSIVTPLLNSKGIIAPEMVKQDMYQPDASFDIWWLGLMVYEMLSGRSLFSIFEGLEKHQYDFLKELAEPPAIDIDITDTCRDFLQKWLDPNPETRSTIKDLLDHPFLSCSVEEMAESKEATGFLSFFSIVASQVSSVKDAQNMSSMVSNDNGDFVQNQLTESGKKIFSN